MHYLGSRIMRAALIQGGIVANIIEVESLDYPGLIEAGNGKIGDSWDGSVFTTPVAVEPIPAKVTRRQALSALFLNGVTKEMIEAKITELLPSPQKDLALIEFRESLEFEYDRALTTTMAAAFGLDKAALFRQAGKL